MFRLPLLLQRVKQQHKQRTQLARRFLYVLPGYHPERRHAGEVSKGLEAVDGEKTAPIKTQEAPVVGLEQLETRLHPELLKALRRRLDGEEVRGGTKEVVIEALLADDRPDAIVQARGGLRKMMTYLVPALQHVYASKDAAAAAASASSSSSSSSSSSPSSPSSSSSPSPQTTSTTTLTTTTTTTKKKKKKKHTNAQGGYISALVLVPTREIAWQISREARNIVGAEDKLLIYDAIGGVDKVRFEDALLRSSSGCFVVATPGRLLDLVNEEPVWRMLQSVDTLVIDEANHLFDAGFRDQLALISGRLAPKSDEQSRQTLIYSSNVPSTMETMAAPFFTSPNRLPVLTIIPKDEVPSYQSVPQHLLTVPDFASFLPVLLASLQAESERIGKESVKAIVFLPTGGFADLYANMINDLYRGILPVAACMSSRCKLGRRKKLLQEFIDARSGILVATDVVARGLTFPNVNYIFQVGLPHSLDSYYERLERFGGGAANNDNNNGKAIIILTKPELFFYERLINNKDKSYINLSKSPLPEEDRLRRVKEDLEPVMAYMGRAARFKLFLQLMSHYLSYNQEMGLSKDDVVSASYTFARDGLGAHNDHALDIDADLAEKMGIVNAPSLKLSRPRPKRRQQQEQPVVAVDKDNVQDVIETIQNDRSSSAFEPPFPPRIHKRAGMSWRDPQSWGEARNLPIFSQDNNRSSDGLDANQLPSGHGGVDGDGDGGGGHGGEHHHDCPSSSNHNDEPSSPETENQDTTHPPKIGT
ncbi:hypothetical protein L249_4024 [Ophiocordyceps polyrhachis-furcata BCC 54312]|uniref:ATP-dependent RNA helicase n=1 Tax=Ophiocordyceps polyrhachis-furcata BCC 54312 TaxID=1330021 RepID=A0A367L591_9HYPO|nr:hypothetical protein L249_4024 [Ophiocordyceps polyrhachis-furcata BCC 54312]